MGVWVEVYKSIWAGPHFWFRFGLRLWLLVWVPVIVVFVAACGWICKVFVVGVARYLEVHSLNPGFSNIPGPDHSPVKATALKSTMVK